MEDTLGVIFEQMIDSDWFSLNPYSNGRYSRRDKIRNLLPLFVRS